MTSNKKFFKKPDRHSQVKTKIVVEYFSAWLSILQRKSKSLTYLDVFSGRGYYENGEPSTPIHILNAIDRFDNDEVFDKLTLHLYEGKRSYFDSLLKSVDAHPTSKRFTTKPIINHLTISSDIVQSLPINESTFTFVDPFGNKGNSLDLLLAVTRNWGCDCIFYLSISGIERNIDDISRSAHLNDLFGVERLEKLRTAHLSGMPVQEFHQFILKNLHEALNKHQRVYFLPFAIEFEKRVQTSHFIVFLSKHPLGFKKMKEIMGKFSHKDQDEVPHFRYTGYQQLELSFGDRKLDLLKRNILSDFGGTTLSVKQFFLDCHRKGYPFLESNMRLALLELEKEGSIVVPDSTGKRRIGTFAPHRTVCFGR